MSLPTVQLKNNMEESQIGTLDFATQLYWLGVKHRNIEALEKIDFNTIVIQGRYKEFEECIKNGMIVEDWVYKSLGMYGHIQCILVLDKYGLINAKQYELLKTFSAVKANIKDGKSGESVGKDEGEGVENGYTFDFTVSDKPKAQEAFNLKKERCHEIVLASHFFDTSRFVQH